MNQSSRAFSVGFVLFVATVLSITGLFWVGSGQGFFSDDATYHVQCPSTTGLKRGSRVYLQGVPVGSVTGIEFVNDLNVPEVRVTFAVSSPAAQLRIREDSRVTLKTEGLLGDVSLHIFQGSADVDQLEKGGELSYETSSLVDELVGGELSMSASRALTRLADVLEKLDSGEGSFGKLLNESTLHDNLDGFSRSLNELVLGLQQTTAEVNGLLAGVRSGRGVLGKLVYSEEYEKRIDALLDSSASLVASLDGIAKRVDSGQGMVGRLVGDDELAAKIEHVVESLDKSSESLQKVLAVVERGEGSIGMLLHDPSIAVSLRDLFLGVQELGYVRNLVRNAERKGREASRDTDRASQLARLQAERARLLASWQDGAEIGRPVPAASTEGADEKKGLEDDRSGAKPSPEGSESSAVVDEGAER